MARSFEFDVDAHFATMRANGVAITAEQEAIARRVYDQQNSSGDVFSGIMNAIVSGFRAVLEFISGNGDSNASLGDRLSSALDNGQQRGDLHTAAETAHRIRQDLTAQGIPARLAEALTGDTTNQPEVAGNLYRVFSNERGVTQRNRDAERQRDEARNPQLAQLAISSATYPVADNPTVSTPVTPAAPAQPAAATPIIS